MVIATLAGVAAALALGVWQLDRADQKKAMQRAIDERGQQAPLATAALPSAAEPPTPGLEHRRADRVEEMADAPGGDAAHAAGHPGYVAEQGQQDQRERAVGEQEVVEIGGHPPPVLAAGAAGPLR